MARLKSFFFYLVLLFLVFVKYNVFMPINRAKILFFYQSIFFRVCPILGHNLIRSLWSNVEPVQRQVFFEGFAQDLYA